jgi:hypothetical protein
VEEKILTLHPEEGKSGVNISKERYDLIRAAIVESLSQDQPTTAAPGGKPDQLAAMTRLPVWVLRKGENGAGSTAR